MLLQSKKESSIAKREIFLPVHYAANIIVKRSFTDVKVNAWKTEWNGTSGTWKNSQVTGL